MGSAFGCFRGDNSEDELQDGECSFCLQWSIEPLLNMYDRMFQRGQTRINPLSRVSVPAASSTQDSNSDMDTYRSPPRPLAYDDPRCSHGQLVQRPNKPSFSPRSQVGSLDIGSLGTAKEDKWYELYDEETKKKNEVQVGDADDISSSCSGNGDSDDDDDDCPICLEEYTCENPRMELQCGHDFHLSCIYEWMERSEVCPVCAKVMLFYENA